MFVTHSALVWTLLIVPVSCVEATLSTSAPRALAPYKGFCSQPADPGTASQVGSQVFTAHLSASVVVGVAVTRVVNQAVNKHFCCSSVNLLHVAKANTLCPSASWRRDHGPSELMLISLN